jgi:hypothetical protein
MAELVVLGIDHNHQSSDPELKSSISGLVESNAVRTIAEENRFHVHTVGYEVAESSGLCWVQIDMSTEERLKAGIYDKLSNRMQIRGYESNGEPIQAIRYAPVEDGIREEFWLDRIEEVAKEERVLVICGCLHCAPFSEKAVRRGHKVLSKLFHPQVLSALKPELY